MKQLIIDQIEVTKNGTIQIRMHKLSSDGDMLGNHRTAIEPGGDIDAQIAAVNTHMGSEGFAPIPDADVARVKATAAATWTPENIAPVTAQVVEAIAVQQAAITEAAAKKAEAEAKAAQEIEDAKAREVAANEAKALAEKAEAASKAAQEAAAKAAADFEAENARVAEALRVAEAAKIAAAEQTKFDKAVADAVAAQLAPVEVAV
jgi:hypothetical protein